MERLCDLHTHTTASDGSFAPEESVRYAKQKGALALAVTDHDTIAGLGRAVAEGERIGQQVIPGIEITTKLESCEIHVVGLFIRWQDREFCENSSLVITGNSPGGLKNSPKPATSAMSRC